MNKVIIFFIITQLFFTAYAKESLTILNINARKAELEQNYHEAIKINLEIFHEYSGTMESLNALIKISSLYEMLGEFNRAEYYHSLILTHEHSQEINKLSSLLRLSTILSNRKEYSKLFSLLSAYKDICENNISLMIKKGEVLEKLYRTDDAIECFENILKKHPYNEFVISSLYNLYVKQNIIDDKLEELEKKSQIAPDNAMFFRLGHLYTLQNNTEKTEYYFKRLADTNYSYYMSKLAAIFRDNNMLEKAYDTYTELINTEPEQSNVHLELAKISLMQNKKDTALDHMNKFLNIFKNINNYSQCIDILLQYQHYNEAQKIIISARERFTQSSLFLKELLNILFYSKKENELEQEIFSAVQKRNNEFSIAAEFCISIIENTSDEKMIDMLLQILHRLSSQNVQLTDLAETIYLMKDLTQRSIQYSVEYSKTAKDHGAHFFNAIAAGKYHIEKAGPVFLEHFPNSLYCKNIYLMLADNYFNKKDLVTCERYIETVSKKFHLQKNNKAIKRIFIVPPVFLYYLVQ